MTLAVIMAWGGHHGVGRPSWRGAVIMAWGGHHGVGRPSWRGAVIMAWGGHHASQQSHAHPSPNLPLVDSRFEVIY